MLTAEQSRRFVQLLRIIGLDPIGPPVPYPAKDVEHIKVTSDSIPVLIFNTSHAKGLRLIINYHPGGFITPLTAGMDIWPGRMCTHTMQLYLLSIAGSTGKQIPCSCK